MLEINNLTTNQIDQDFLKTIARTVLEGEDQPAEPAECNISLAIVGENRIRKINKMYRGKNRVTDVLSFPEQEVKIGKFKVGPTQSYSGLGEIIICLKRVKKNARRAETSLDQELALVLIHGILHLLGYNHNKDEQAQQMREKEQFYLKKLFQ